MKLLGKSVSGHFQSFYEEVVSRIGKPKFYPNPSGDLLGSCRMEGGVLTIRLRTDMSKPRFEQNAAHELVHALQLVEEEWTVVLSRFPDEHPVVKTGEKLASLALDLNVEDRLRMLGFDSTRVKSDQYRNLRKAVLGEKVPKTGGLRWCNGAMMYAYVSLTQPLRRWNKLRTLMLQRVPYVARKGEEILTILREHGWHNPEQALSSAVAVRNSLGLHKEWLTIKDVRTGDRY